LEYYFEAVDASGNKGTDGNGSKPYFVAVRERIQIPDLKSDAAEGERPTPFWKNPWVWAGAALAVVGGIAIGSSGGKENKETGTITVE
jgi:hypothetical protein